MSINNSVEIHISNPPTDLISNIEFHPTNNNYLLASSWDGHLYIYDINSKKQIKAKYNYHSSILDCCFQDGIRVASGGLDGNLNLIDINQNSENVIGNHNAPIKCVEYCPAIGVFATGSWDTYVKLWDPRFQESNDINKDNSLAQMSKVYSLAVCDYKIIVGTSERKVNVWDLRMKRIEQSRDSVLKFQTRQIKTFPDKKGFVLSSIEGRVAVEYLDSNPEIQKNKYAFKCHRIKDDVSSIEKVYPVNAIAFHKQYGTFATGGSDGFVYIWDAYNKKRLCNFHRYPNQITSLAFSPDDNFLAISSSHLHNFSESDTHSDMVDKEGDYYSDRIDRIFVREVSEKETKPK
ncbi:unnamed protein product [Gordionus sp. m RMFG-2023]|uniref:mitotic checkpoint protein BUB3-like n=1 Tax=Gordionus sp. m RMFG-2023 TaxID=3053472 RepID=UPI0030E14D63